ncbi:hypothetical protein BCR33DRAFT_738752 [Rhizoclosmatium globosum]|uniref:Uncharacterized protein n=1 Tax=Rhizoclosmatium globosum TaxID=329046 RepID=A0A1Y2C908_9FUNG|nr:hypothetical protein BCR33DRAFT_738752 [Rhizoclosmatium globosum]|eukprot:ORY43512.1 hypothetical protein BCR33DRAFT_738752 [Rhizoclosmatium globosum]
MAVSMTIQYFSDPICTPGNFYEYFLKPSMAASDCAQQAVTCQPLREGGFQTVSCIPTTPTFETDFFVKASTLFGPSTHPQYVIGKFFNGDMTCSEANGPPSSLIASALNYCSPNSHLGTGVTATISSGVLTLSSCSIPPNPTAYILGDIGCSPSTIISSLYWTFYLPFTLMPPPAPTTAQTLANNSTSPFNSSASSTATVSQVSQSTVVTGIPVPSVQAKIRM